MTPRPKGRSLTTNGISAQYMSERLDIVSKLLAVLLPLFTAIFYLAGRSYLYGWYDAAGVNELTFNWPFADILFFGAFTRTFNTAVVLVFLLTSLMFMLAIAVFPLTISAPPARRREGESKSAFATRKRLARQISMLRRAGEDAREERLQWRILRKRPPITRKHRAKRRQRRKFFRDAFAFPRTPSLMFSSVLIVLLFYALSIQLLSFSAEEGGLRFVSDYVGATGRCPPLPSGIATVTCDADDTDAIGLELNRASLCRRFRYVHVYTDREPRGDHVERDVRGWLIQNSDKQLLLLTSKGVTLLTFGDSFFRWNSVPYAECMVCPSPSGQLAHGRLYQPNRT